jgi:hypothetical protein
MSMAKNNVAPRVPSPTAAWVKEKVLPIVGLTALAWSALFACLMMAL